MTRSRMKKIREAFEALESKGRLDPEHVVDAAQDEHHPLHDHFEWDDSIAGHKYRLFQAEALIKRVKLRVKHENIVSIIPIYVKDESTSERGYISLKHGDFVRADAEATVASELARLEGNVRRSRGVVQSLHQQHPRWELLEFFEQRLLEIVERPRKPPPRPSAGATAPPPSPPPPI
jgi:hypothetical protein